MPSFELLSDNRLNMNPEFDAAMRNLYNAGGNWGTRINLLLIFTDGTRKSVTFKAEKAFERNNYVTDLIDKNAKKPLKRVVATIGGR